MTCCLTTPHTLDLHGRNAQRRGAFLYMILAFLTQSARLTQHRPGNCSPLHRHEPLTGSTPGCGRANRHDLRVVRPRDEFCIFIKFFNYLKSIDQQEQEGLFRKTETCYQTRRARSAVTGHPIPTRHAAQQAMRAASQHRSCNFPCPGRAHGCQRWTDWRTSWRKRSPRVNLAASSAARSVSSKVIMPCSSTPIASCSRMRAINALNKLRSKNSGAFS